MSLTLCGLTDTLKPEHLKYAQALDIAGAAFEELEKLFASADFKEKINWKKEAEGKQGVVFTKSDERGKIVTVRTEVLADTNLVFDDMWNGFNNIPTWNTNIQFANKIVSPTENFDICNYGNNDLFVITGRDMLIARIYRKIPDGYLMATKSIELPEFPERKDKVRAEIILAGARVLRHPTNPDMTVLDAVMLGDAKGSIPKALINPVLAKIALKGAKLNKDHFEQLAAIANSETKL